MKKFTAGDFLFFYCPLKTDSKLAAVVSKKVDKRAVARNSWRRRVYDLVGTDLIKSQQPLALVCLYKGTSIPENTEDLAAAWQQFKVYAEAKQLLKFTL
jgi:ribonuclease P protein component